MENHVYYQKKIEVVDLFFIMNAMWIGFAIVSGISFYDGNRNMGMLFLVLAVFELILVVFIYGMKKQKSNSNFDCMFLECGLEALPDCLSHADCDCIP